MDNKSMFSENSADITKADIDRDKNLKAFKQYNWSASITIAKEQNTQ